MRIVIAGLLGGLVMFLWGAIAHTVLPLGEAGFSQPRNEDIVLAAMKTGLPDDAAYILPAMSRERMHDKAAMDAYVTKTRSSPYAFVVYKAQGGSITEMTRPLIVQWVSDTLAALIVAAILAGLVAGFGRRVLVAGALGAFSWLAISVPFWNWYGFPWLMTAGTLVEQVVGWLLAGCVSAWWLGRRGRTPR
jgi:hypothetical protein